MTNNASLHLIVGLGNPGRQYDRTGKRRLYDRGRTGTPARTGLARAAGTGQVAKGAIHGVPVILAKPQTFMNLSGEAVSGLLNWYKLPVGRLIIVSDDLDLPLGTIRVRARGSAGGHNGITSIIQHCARRSSPVCASASSARPVPGEQVDWVLGHFTKEQARELEPALGAAADAVEFWLANGIDKAMNAFNGGLAAGKEPRRRPGPVQRSRPPPPRIRPPPLPRPLSRVHRCRACGGEIARCGDSLRGRSALEDA